MADKIRGYHPSGACNLCGQWVERLSLDHMVPLFEGGSHDMTNVQWLCKPCHHSKSNKDRQRWNATIGQTEEHREKIRRAMQRPDVQAKLSTSSLGRTHSAETRQKISDLQRGTKRSEETKARMSLARAAFWARKSPEEKQAIFEKGAAKQRGRKAGSPPSERRQRISESQRLKWASGDRKPGPDRDEKGKWISHAS